MFLPFFSYYFGLKLGGGWVTSKGPTISTSRRNERSPPLPPLSLLIILALLTASRWDRERGRRERDWEGWREGSRRSKRRGGTQRGTRSPRDLSLRLVLLPSKSPVLSAKYPLLRPLISSFSIFHFFSIFFFLFIQSHSIFHYQ